MLCIITVVHNRCETTKSFVKKLATQSFQDFHLVLVDDGSTDDSGSIVSQILPQTQLTTLTGSGNLYWGGGLQFAFEFLKSKQKNEFSHVLICNDDISFDTSFLADMLNEYKLTGPKSMLHPNQHYIEMNETTFGYNISWDFSKMVTTINPAIVNVIDTRALLLGYEDFIESTGFIPSLLSHYRSDWEFTHRMYKRGFQIIVSKNIQITIEKELKPEFDLKNISNVKEFLAKKWSVRSNVSIRSELVFDLIHAPFHLKPIFFVRSSYRFIKSFLYYALK
jgi:GT2 family glycosyltransferase